MALMLLGVESASASRLELYRRYKTVWVSLSLLYNGHLLFFSPGTSSSLLLFCSSHRCPPNHQIRFSACDRINGSACYRYLCSSRLFDFKSSIVICSIWFLLSISVSSSKLFLFFSISKFFSQSHFAIRKVMLVSSVIRPCNMRL